MDHKELLERDKRLIEFSRQSDDHRAVSYIVRSRTLEARAEVRAAAIIAIVSASIAVLLRKEDPYFLSSLSGAAGTLFAMTGMIKIVLDDVTRTGIEKLLEEHPCRLKMILQSIRSDFADLKSITDEVEDEFFS